MSFVESVEKDLGLLILLYPREYALLIVTEFSISNPHAESP